MRREILAPHHHSIAISRGAADPEEDRAAGPEAVRAGSRAACTTTAASARPTADEDHPTAAAHPNRAAAAVADSRPVAVAAGSSRPLLRR